MASGEVFSPVAKKVLVILFVQLTFANAQFFTPPYFNLAQSRNITATATCGEDVVGPELFCRLTGAIGGERPEEPATREIIQGQLCDYCYPSIPQQNHPPEYAIDGTERWWQSPPLSRGAQYNQVNLTIHLGQEFHVAYVFIRMANSPRPGVWVLERSVDYGKTWQPWQYFADTPSDCNRFFKTLADQPILADDQVICSTEFSKVVPLDSGEIVVSLVNGRPSASNFSAADTLQEWTKATNVQLRLLRTKNLLGHLMAVARQDPTVTRRYYYSIKDISIGGRCVCNGHADACDRPPELDSNKLLCQCLHNTCGEQCEYCCPGFVQKRWRQARANRPFMCEPCQCYSHTDECIFDEQVEKEQRSIDIHGNYEGGGVCQNCQDNTMGINCELCKPGFYRPYGVNLDAVDVCESCRCDLHVSTGECEEGSGRCFCRPEYAGLNCDRCNAGYYGYPVCIPCECHINGTEDGICLVTAGNCPCKVNYDGRKCDMCAFGYYNFPECRACECNLVGAAYNKCNPDSGQCECRVSYGSRDCSACADGFYNYPRCEYCDCDPAGTEAEICDKLDGSCICKQNHTGDRCDRCVTGFYGFPNCQKCECTSPGSLNDVCADSGQCYCRVNYAGLKCERCAAGYYRYPDCVSCQCDIYGSLGVSCDQISGQCSCRGNFEGRMCEKCKENLFNYPMCEVCNCNPDGAKELPGYPLGGCGIVTSGLLCECKDRVQGRICDECKPGYWNLNRNNPLGCEECACNKPGTLTGSNVCDTETGQCMCKPDVGGRNCDQCRDGFYDLQENNPFGCINCMCNLGGSQSAVCNKRTGQCVCRPRVAGQKCDQPIKTHFYPDLHQIKFEIEDGVTPEGARIRYGFDEYVFKDYSWRGYAILTSVQPEVKLEINVRTPSLYQIIYRYVNHNDKSVRGHITLTPESPTDNVQSGEIVFLPTLEPKFATVTAGAVSAFVLNPGRWTVSTKVPERTFLDFFVLIPQDYYEATVLQQRVTSPCQVPGDPGPCLHYQYPDLVGFPFVPGSEGYNIVDQQRQPVLTYPITSITSELDTVNLAHLSQNQSRFILDLVVTDPGLYVLVVTYLNPTERSQEVDVDVASLAGREKSKITLYSCKYSTLCRQVFRNLEGSIAIYNITTGFVSLTFNGKEDVDISIDSVTAIPVQEWTREFIRPRIICIRINGVCIPSAYSIPVGTLRVDFELPPNQGRQATDLPPNIWDKNVGLVQLTDEESDIEICRTLTKSGQYVILFHYYMPTQIGLTIPVSVKVNGQTIQGVFKPTYCPGVTGCRGTVTFGQSNIVNLNNVDVCILVTKPTGGKLWLDYALIVPADQFNAFDLELQPIDKSIDFLRECVNEGFELKSDSEFCKESIFTLTTEFNKGAVQCECNVDGSLNFNCEAFGGQCQCRENIIGRTCSVCHPGFYGFPRCRQCNCPFGLCHSVTGECICPPRVEGDRCDRCKAEAYGFDALIGCQECRCNPRGVQIGDLNCDQITGQCYCLPNVGGRRCDSCLPGHHSFPYCDPCDCDPKGTVAAICDQVTSQCLCKQNVVGPRCDQCADGMFALSGDKPKGCTVCFCFGITTRCISSSLNWDTISTMDGWGITNTKDNYVQEAGNVIAVKARDNIEDTSNALYWVAPQEYLNNKINSYGGRLLFSVLFTLPRESAEGTVGLVKPDVILMGNNMTVVHTHAQQPVPSAPLDMDVLLFEYNFRHSDSGSVVSREQFMMILFNLQALHIRASYFSIVDEVRLSDVSMEYATPSGRGSVALTVEQCQCPSSYQGLSCQECAPGHYRSRSTPYLGICVKCNCNGHTDDCDSITGECFNCQDNTMGPNCEQCLPGYFGDPVTGSCQICSCPLPLASNNFATTCVLSEDGVRTYCECVTGYYGASCESCAPGYFGNPWEVGSYCQPCSCNENIDVNNPRSCDRFTGQCLLCLNHTAGNNCEMCEDWYWGDAIYRKDCQPCSCDYCGSESCAKSVGTCTCKTNVVGADCSQCAPSTWGFDYCTGCRACECGLGSVQAQCDLRSGQCTCQPGVEGYKCDKCKAGHWDLRPSGCLECQCQSDGSVGCDDRTGRCLCLPGVTGQYCDRCQDRWVLVPGQGCQECDYCIHLLLDDLEILSRNITVVRRQLADVSVGVAAFQRLSQYNASVTELRSSIQFLHDVDQDELQDMLDPMNRSLENVQNSVRENFDKTNEAVTQAEQLRESGRTLGTVARDINYLIQDQVTEAEGSVQFVKTILARILASIKVTSIEAYITNTEQILQRIQAHNFSEQNDTVVVELDNAKAALVKVQEVGLKIEQQLKATNKTEFELDDLSQRLEDLADKSDISVANNALDALRRLRAQNLEVLQGLTETIDESQGDSINLLETGKAVLDYARDALENTTNILLELSRISSQLEAAQLNRIKYVNDLQEGIKMVSPLGNQSYLHSLELEEQARALDNVYTMTRDLSASPVMAGQAYQNIVKFTNAAHNSSLEAVDDANRALNESNGNGEEALESMIKGRSLLTEAEIALAKTKEVLLDDMNAAKASTDNVDNETKKLKEQLLRSKTELDSLNEESTNARSQNVINRSDRTHAEGKSAEEVVDRIISLLPEDKRKLEQISPDRSAANLNIKKIENSIAAISENKPEIEELLQPLTINATRLVEVGQGLEVNVKELKEKIELAREQANRIRVGLKFLGNTTLTARNPPKLDQAGSYSHVSLYFKTTQSDGLILYVGGQQRVENLQTDFLSLEIQNGYLEYKYNLGSGPASIVSSKPVADGQWHQAIAERIGKTGSLTVRTDKQSDERTEGTSEGTFTVLELNPSTTTFYFGGLPSEAVIPRDVATQFFRGSMEDIQFDENPVGLWNFVDAENNLLGENARNVMKEIESSGMRFNGLGYVVLSRNRLGFRANRTVIQLRFQTYSEDGLLLFMGDNKRDFLSIEMKGGRAVFQYDLGGGAATLSSDDRFNDGEWHDLAVSRINREGLLSVDGREASKRSSPGSLSELSTTEDIFIGGIDKIYVPSNLVGSSGFDGCIRDVQFDANSWDLNDNVRAKGVIRGCPPKIARVATFTETYPDAFLSVPLDVGIGSMFDVTFKMRTREKEALLLYASDDTQDSIFSVRVEDGKIVVTSSVDGDAVELASRINTYNDGEWHYISIMKMGLKLTMNIDDYEMMDTTAESGDPELITTTPLYFGGFPPGFELLADSIPSSRRLIGCIGDITVNKRFINLVTIPESSRRGVTLVECPVKSKSEIETSTQAPDVTASPVSTPSPDQCQLPLKPDLDSVDDTVGGTRFGKVNSSRLEFTKMPTGVSAALFRSRSFFRLDIRTEGRNGLIFYVADKPHTDFIGLYLLDGKVVFRFNCGSGTATITSPEAYNDGKWHTISFGRNMAIGTLEVDGNVVGTGTSPGNLRSLNIEPPYYFGGLPNVTLKQAMANVGDGFNSFPGCINNLRVQNVAQQYLSLGSESRQFDVKPCSDAYELGTFFPDTGGYITLYDKFKVGSDLEIHLDVRPRTQNGVLLAVHGMDYLILQLVEGKVVLSADNGAGPFTTTYSPSMRNTLCDGNWHSIIASKIKNMVNLTVDGVPVQEHGIGSPNQNAADTNDPLYIGGLKDKSVKGLLTNEIFVGCIRNVYLNNRLNYLAQGKAEGDVQVDACPVS